MKAKFNYPKKFVTLPEYTQHAGQIVEVIRKLNENECDDENQPMFLIRADDGWEGHAHGHELEKV